MSAARVRFLVTIGCFLLCVAPAHVRAQATPSSGLPQVVANDNRVPGGRMEAGVVELELVAQLAGWLPDTDVDSLVTIQAFGEGSGAPRIPGPLLRVMEGGDVRVAITNRVPDSTLVVHGLRAGAVGVDTIHVLSGGRREVRFRAGAPGTYLYWGTTRGHATPGDRLTRDSQLTGAIVIDPVGASPDPDERIFVITVIDILPDTTARPPQVDDIFELAINGRSWPHSERLEYAVGDTVRWRWLNGSYLPHPLHLHGFHYRVLATGRGSTQIRHAPNEVRDVVTEFVMPGGSFVMEWTPTRAGNWIFHCHMAPHTTPFPPRPDSVQMHEVHDVAQHALEAMAGLVLGIRTVAPPGSVAPLPTPSQHLRLLLQQAAPAERLLRTTGYVLQNGEAPRADSVRVPGPPLLLTRGETTAITVINRTDEPTTVHWHGMELESVYDGVAGWSGADSNLAPLIAPGDSFAVSFTPPRAGTYIYHTHMDEGLQLATGAYGPLLVLEPGQTYDPTTDLTLVIGRVVENGANVQAINGSAEPAPLLLDAGTTYRIRLINILPASPVELDVRADSALLTWTPISKDGAELPRALQVDMPSALAALGTGETYDFLWTPDRPMEAVLTAWNEVDEFVLRQRIRVR